jgi:hypothetical protein
VNADGICRWRDGPAVLVVLQQPDQAGLEAWAWLDLGFQYG